MVQPKEPVIQVIKVYLAKIRKRVEEKNLPTLFLQLPSAR